MNFIVVLFGCNPVFICTENIQYQNMPETRRTTVNLVEPQYRQLAHIDKRRGQASTTTSIDEHCTSVSQVADTDTAPRTGFIVENNF